MEKLRKLTQMTEHPEQYSDEEWREVFNGETVSQEQIEQAWQRFEDKHPRRSGRPTLKIAASFIGILLLSGIAVAAILQSRQKESVMTEIAKPKASADGMPVSASTNPVQEPVQEPRTVIFEDAELQQITDSLAIHYKVRPGYRRDSVRKLRLYYEWNQRNSIAEITEQLNNFEQVNIRLKGDSLIVE